jgi:hypothetical protein
MTRPLVESEGSPIRIDGHVSVLGLERPSRTMKSASRMATLVLSVLRLASMTMMIAQTGHNFKLASATSAPALCATTPVRSDHTATRFCPE